MSHNIIANITVAGKIRKIKHIMYVNEEFENINIEF